MGIGTIFKRLFQAVGCLGLIWFGGGALFVGYVSYVDRNPEAKARLQAAGEAVEHKVDEDAGFLANLDVLLSAWWNSDEHYAEKQRDDALEAKARADRKREEEERRFNSPLPSAENDYYAQSEPREGS